MDPFATSRRLRFQDHRDAHRTGVDEIKQSFRPVSLPRDLDALVGHLGKSGGLENPTAFDGIAEPPRRRCLGQTGGWRCVLGKRRADDVQYIVLHTPLREDIPPAGLQHAKRLGDCHVGLSKCITPNAHTTSSNAPLS